MGNVVIVVVMIVGALLLVVVVGRGMGAVVGADKLVGEDVGATIVLLPLSLSSLSITLRMN